MVTSPGLILRARVKASVLPVATIPVTLMFAPPLVTVKRFLGTNVVDKELTSVYVRVIVKPSVLMV